MALTAGGDTRLVPAADISAHADLDRADVTLRGPASTQTITRPPALSLSGLLLLAGIDPSGVDHVDVTRPDGTPVVLSRADVTGTTFADGPAAFWIDDQSTHFLRPVRDGADVNATDNIATPTGQALAVAVHGGPVLSVSASASSASVGQGEAVTFGASVAGDPGGLVYTWRFGDGESATGASVTHAYARQGRFVASVTVVSADDSSGAAQTPAVTVGAPAPGTSTDATTGGEDAGGGEASDDTGAAVGQKRPRKQRPAGGSGSSGGGGSTTGSSGGGQSGAGTPDGGGATSTSNTPAPNASTPAPARPATPTPSPATPAPPATTPSPSAPAAKPKHKRDAKPERDPAPTADADDGQIQGVLLAGVDDSAIRSGLAAVAQPTAAATTRRGQGSGVDARWAIGLGAVLALVAGGAIRETRRRVRSDDPIA